MFSFNVSLLFQVRVAREKNSRNGRYFSKRKVVSILVLVLAKCEKINNVQIAGSTVTTVLKRLFQLSRKAVTTIMKKLSQLSGKAVIAIMKKLSQLSGKTVCFEHKPMRSKW